MNPNDSIKFGDNQINNQINPCFFKGNSKDNHLNYFNRTVQNFSSTNEKEKFYILNSVNIMNPENLYKDSKNSGYMPNITNNINIKNVNIINCSEGSFFKNNDNNDKNILLFKQINLNNIKNDNTINNNINNYLKENHFINFSAEIETNKNKNYEISSNLGKNKEIANIYNNEVNAFHNFQNNNQEHGDFLNYINNLKFPLIKFLTTKKGICEMSNYLNLNGNKDLSLLLQLLNKDGLTTLMKNKFGNYFIQEIIRNASYDQIKMILFLISDNFIEISENISGTYVIQRLIDKISSIELRMFILKLIENKELEMAFNSNATFVLQKIIEKVPDIERIQLNEIIINNFFFLSLNQGCVFIVEKFIDTITINLNKIKIKNIICIHCLQLSNNPYGNYLIQYILKTWKNENINNIHNIIIQNSNLMVQQRYASNVIEKCFEIFDDKKRKRMMINICLGGDILNIIKNQYGHYVLNKIIKYIDEDIKIEIENILNNKMSEMSKTEKSKSKKFISLLKNSKFKKKDKK